MQGATLSNDALPVAFVVGLTERLEPKVTEN